MNINKRNIKNAGEKIHGQIEDTADGVLLKARNSKWTGAILAVSALSLFVAGVAAERLGWLTVVGC